MKWSKAKSIAGLVFLFTCTGYCERRTVLVLDGTWEITDSKDADPVPVRFDHKVSVPGLVHSSIPAFADVDLFDSRQVIQNRVSQGKLPSTALVQNAGVPHQDRNWFWYHRTFKTSERRSFAILRINKAQFGAAIWLNGQKIGEHFPCFSAAILDVTKAIHWGGKNDLVIRVGAHPGVLPPNISAGTDFEKNRWTPGIYDSVSLQLSDAPIIETVQVAPRLADSSIVVQTELRNPRSTTAVFRLNQTVRRWKATAVAAKAPVLRMRLAPGERKLVTQTIHIPNPKLWSPEAPNLYALDTDGGGDSAETRFGMREFRFDTATKRAYLNGHVYFLRGSNITLHRFFEDPHSGSLPWNDEWVRKLLVTIPKQMHWNAFRFCIGPVPDRWLEIADEAGLLIQNEYFVWTGHDWHGAENQIHFDTEELKREYSEWMRDNWNHPSVVIWDANNETWDSTFGDEIIPAVRKLDLSGRPWENSYNPPAGTDDPVEDHPYEFQSMASGGPAFDLKTLESPGGLTPGALTGHALILNEYGWLWVNRDGKVTELTKKLYPRLLGESATAKDRLGLNAYLLAGLTEYWRAYRQYAGVLHFVYLTSSDPEGYTSDHFIDVEKLQLHPEFADYMSNAFAPLGVYLSFWQPELRAGSTATIAVMMINDEPRPTAGDLMISLEDTRGEEIGRKSLKFSLAGLGQQTYYVNYEVPTATGSFLLKATAKELGEKSGTQTVSRRRLQVVKP